ncbi:hypothetical protein KI387_029124, partial [Taxus chinensis]
SESSYESTARTAKFGDCDSGEEQALRTGVVITGATYYYTGIDWGATGAVSPGTGSGTAVGTTTSTSTAAGTGTGTGTATGIGYTGKAGATTIRSRGTGPSSHGGTGPLYGGESRGP